MNVSVEHLGPCKKLLRVEVDVQAIETEQETVVTDLMRRARLPGFRPGKAPRPVVVKAFSSQIAEELRKRMVSTGYQKALEEQKLRPITYPKIEEDPWETGKPFSFTATVETEPEFEIPDYKGLPVRRETKTVSEEDVERALLMLREQKAGFADRSRPVQLGDFVVVNYTGSCEGKPITDLAPAARGLTEQKNFWLQVQTEHFIPGFTDQLVGASAGEKRTVTVTFPADFVTRELAGKVGTFEVEVVQVKEKEMPALDDAFARTYGAENLEQLRVGVRNDLERELKMNQKRKVRDQLVATLLGRVSCELPESMVQNETKSVVYDIVRANQERGVPKEAIDERKEEIYTVANNSARERVKAMLVLARIAEKEGIKATPEELTERVVQLAVRYQIKPEKLVKQLQDRGALGTIRQQIEEAKVLDALELYANVEEVPA